jgi:hypothetical protein
MVKGTKNKEILEVGDVLLIDCEHPACLKFPVGKRNKPGLTDSLHGSMAGPLLLASAGSPVLGPSHGQVSNLNHISAAFGLPHAERFMSLNRLASGRDSRLLQCCREAASAG